MRPGRVKLAPQGVLYFDDNYPAPTTPPTTQPLILIDQAPENDRDPPAYYFGDQTSADDAWARTPFQRATFEFEGWDVSEPKKNKKKNDYDSKPSRTRA